MVLAHVYLGEVDDPPKMLTRDEARRIAANIAKLLELLQRRSSAGDTQSR